jgi:hypothetical protein
MIFHKGKVELLTMLLALALILSSCSRDVVTEQSPVSKQSPIIEHHIVIDWTDFLKINNISYTGSWQAALTDPSKLGEEIGKVTFHVADVVNDPHYVVKDGDAALLAVGSVVRAIADYPNHEIVTVQDANSIGGYKIYVEDSKQKQLISTFEEAVNKQITEISFYSMADYEKPIVTLNNGREQFLISMLQRAAQEQIHPDKSAALTNPVYYKFVMNSGSAIGYVDTIYKEDNYYYWSHPEANQLQSAFAYYFANERDAVYKNQSIEFAFPNHADALKNGERIKRDGGINNITLISADGKTEHSLFTQESIDGLWKKAIEVNPSDGESKASLFMAASAMPVDNGQQIAYATNKDTIITKQGDGSFNINLVQIDGTNDRILLDGSKYGGNILLLDSVGDRIIAAGADRSILDISISTGKVHHYPVNGHLDALSVDGQYVLYRKMIDDSQVGTEIAYFDLTSGKSIDLGQMEKNYVFTQGVK